MSSYFKKQMKRLVLLMMVLSENPIPLTEVLETKRLKLLGHILRRPRAHPQQQVTFASSLALPKAPLNRRVGRPRKNWTIENMRKAWETLQNVDPTHPNPRSTTGTAISVKTH